MLVTNMVNESRSPYFPFNTPRIVDEGKYKDEVHQMDNLFVMKTNKERNAMILKLWRGVRMQKDPNQIRPNTNDFLLNVPFGFIHDGKAYILAVATDDGK